MGFPSSLSLTCHTKHYTGAFVARALARCHEACSPSSRGPRALTHRLGTCCGGWGGPRLPTNTVQWLIRAVKINALLRVGSGSPPSCHVRVINTFLSIMHAGGRISNIWLDNKSLPSARERSCLWPSEYLLFFRMSFMEFSLGGGERSGQRSFLVKLMLSCIQHCPSPTSGS